jgi:hypothetical protein
MPTIEQLEALKRKAAERRDSLPPDFSTGDFAPTVYIRDGVTDLRVYLDRNSNYLERKVFHSYSPPAVDGRKPFPIIVECIGDDCKICKEVEKKAFIPKDRLYPFKRQIKTVVYGYIYRSTMTSPYVKLKTPVLIVGPPDIRTTMDEYIAEMSPEDLAAFFDPKSKENVWRITKDGYNFSMEPIEESATMKLLPTSYVALSDCIYKEGMTNPRDVRTIIQALETLSRNFHSLSEPKSSEDTEPANDTPLDQDRNESEYFPGMSSVKGPAADVKKDCFGDWNKRNLGISRDPDCHVCEFNYECENEGLKSE